MAIIAGTATRYDLEGLRESLSDLIFDISPEETPLLSALSREPASQTLEEWQTDALPAPDTTNAQLEGDDITSFPAVVKTSRVGNFTQISRKLLAVSGTSEVVSKAGRASELAYQLPRRSVSLKKDIEAMMFENIAGDAGSTTVPRRSAGLGAWITTNESRGAGGSNSGHTTGVPTTTATDGTQRALTEALFKTVIRSLYNSGANLRNVFVGPVNKQRISEDFTGIVTRNFDLSNVDPRPTAVIAAVDVYVSDFGQLKIFPSRWQRERDLFFLDFDFLGMYMLRDFRIEELAKTGDAEKRMLLAEWTLKVKNEAALGGVFDLTTT